MINHEDQSRTRHSDLDIIVAVDALTIADAAAHHEFLCRLWPWLWPVCLVSLIGRGRLQLDGRVMLTQRGDD